MSTIPASDALSLMSLRASLDGQAYSPADPGYDEARATWNLAFDQRPAVVVAARSTADVAAAVRHAAEQGLDVAVQATGHGVALTADDNLLIVTSQLDHVRVDPAGRTAWVGAGAKWGAVLEPAQAVGLAPLLGSSPQVGAVGYTLGGGLGWLARKHGLAADSVRWFEVVTADGDAIRASTDEHADLFWALRGAGAGAFGIVTGMEIDLYPVDEVYGGNLLYPAEMAREVLARWRDWIADAPDELTSSVVLMNFPPLPVVPEPVRGQSFVLVRGCWAGPIEEGERQLAYWRRWREPVIDMFGPMPFSAVATISNDPVDPMPGRASTEWLTSLDDGLVDVLPNLVYPSGGPTPIVFGEIRHVGGAVAAVAEAERGAYGNRERDLLFETVGVIPAPEAEPAVDAAIARLKDGIRPYTSGTVYLNFLEGEEKRQRTRASFDEPTWARLRAVKAAYDPANRFRFGLAIDPDA